jgi:hypothetical protein
MSRVEHKLLRSSELSKVAIPHMQLGNAIAGGPMGIGPTSSHYLKDYMAVLQHGYGDF